MSAYASQGTSRPLTPDRLPPDLSFVMAAFNAAPWIEAAITSALAQSGVTVEVIVVDDASPDDTAARVQEIADHDPRVVLVRRAQCGGPSAARNLALDRARGTWIAILDADDEVAPDRGRDLIALAQRSGSDVVADNVVRFIDGKPMKAWRMLPTLQDGSELRIDLAEYLFQNHLTGGGSNLGYLKPIFARTFLARHAIRYNERMQIGEDFDFCLRCLMAGAVLVVCGRPYYRYRVLASSLSRTLTCANVDEMQAAYARLALDAAPDRRTRNADFAYHRSMRAMRAYLYVREAFRDRRWGRVLAGAGQPEFWLVALRFGSRALRQRMT